MKVRSVFLLFSILCWSGCDQLPLADNRARPEPPALPAQLIAGDPFVNLTATKMNVVYVGIPNPLDLQATGVNPDNLTIMATPPGYITEYGKSFNLNVSTPGIQTVKVRHKGKLLNEFSFRAKRIPDPQAQLGGMPTGRMEVEEFKAQRGLVAVLEDFDFDLKCVITSYVLTRYSDGKASRPAVNVSGGFKSSSERLVQLATANDVYAFTDVQAKCPGDKVSRFINALVFEIN